MHLTYFIYVTNFGYMIYVLMYLFGNYLYIIVWLKLWLEYGVLLNLDVRVFSFVDKDHNAILSVYFQLVYIYIDCQMYINI